uniref:2-(3-amino-3-carboxypropyl)histidine synthase subunit 1 n=1 Tax=Dermatophagoides pteronyssinus TaxID=6956 RepID=A0A6P6Y5T3_DERPT|nr:2-(3-amino-3-carboxypropyl)histidine synthase subunit 1-like [Dermatophagoides pteronyssinus]
MGDDAALERLSWLDAVRRTQLAANISALFPRNYNFEVPKTLRRLSETRSRSVCLQFPEGLMAWAESLAALFEEYGDGVENVYVIGDVTYGACCVDDLKAQFLRCDFLVHYAHSCLVPVSNCTVKCLYIFVEIALSSERFVKVASRFLNNALELAEDAEAHAPKKVALLATIQFSSVILKASAALAECCPHAAVSIPQCYPLTPGETLGCTSPVIDADVAIFVADGRFHIESAMMMNPAVRFYRYDPMQQVLFRETFNYELFHETRRAVLARFPKNRKIGVVLSTLGRQGSLRLAQRVLQKSKEAQRESVCLLLSEIKPQTIRRLGPLAFVNVGCPRLALDWGAEFFSQPFVSTFEFYKALADNESGVHVDLYIPRRW